MACEHLRFDAQVDVNRIEDIGRFSADVRINCRDCGVAMVFLGLPQGLDVNGATTGAFGIEGRFAIHPHGETRAELPLGFQQRQGE